MYSNGSGKNESENMCSDEANILVEWYFNTSIFRDDKPRSKLNEGYKLRDKRSNVYLYGCQLADV